MNTFSQIAASVHLIGAGGLASDFVACFKDVCKISGCWDDALAIGSTFNGIPVLGSLADLFALKYSLPVIISIGNPSVRAKIAGMLTNTAHMSPVIVHPDARLYDRDQISLGAGCVIFPGVFITTKVNIGAHSLVHIGTSIHHDVTIGSCSVLMPGVRITGNVTVGDNVFLGPGEAFPYGSFITDGTRVEKVL